MLTSSRLVGVVGRAAAAAWVDTLQHATMQSMSSAWQVLWNSISPLWQGLQRSRLPDCDQTLQG